MHNPSSGEKSDTIFKISVRDFPVILICCTALYKNCAAISLTLYEGDLTEAAEKFNTKNNCSSAYNPKGMLNREFKLLSFATSSFIS